MPSQFCRRPTPRSRPGEAPQADIRVRVESGPSTLARSEPPLLVRSEPGVKGALGVAGGHGPQEAVPDMPKMV